MEPEDRSPAGRSSSLSPEERSRVVRAAALRPLNVIVLIIGGVFFAATLAWWMVPLTLATYALLVFFASRDPVFARSALYGRAGVPRAAAAGGGEVSPERRARWLPRGETREKVEAALVVYRKVVVAIEESDEVTRAVLEGSVPKLHAAADRLVDVAERREKAAEVLRELGRHTAASSPAGASDAAVLRERVREADAEIFATFESLLALRSRVVRVSIDSGNPERAVALNASLDELNARLEALSETMTPPDGPDRDG